MRTNPPNFDDSTSKPIVKFHHSETTVIEELRQVSSQQDQIAVPKVNRRNIVSKLPNSNSDYQDLTPAGGSMQNSAS